MLDRRKEFRHVPLHAILLPGEVPELAGGVADGAGTTVTFTTQPNNPSPGITTVTATQLDLDWNAWTGAVSYDIERNLRVPLAGIARAAQYDWDVVAAAYERVYARVLEGKPRAAA